MKTLFLKAVFYFQYHLQHIQCLYSTATDERLKDSSSFLKPYVRMWKRPSKYSLYIRKKILFSYQMGTQEAIDR